MSIMRWDPFRDLETLEREVERSLGAPLFRRIPWRRSEMAEVAAGPAMDMWETDDAIMVKAMMPGVKPDEIEVSVAEGVLTIRGQFQRREEKEGDRFHRQEIMYGMYQRSLALPPYANADMAEAHYENGVLTLKFPKKEAARSKSIPVQAQSNGGTGSGGRRQIEGEARQNQGQQGQGQNQGQQGQNQGQGQGDRK
ncbi:MAG: Hsp20/alpha crystallin family protein [Chloroflexi bacterium]|nr:Hsp20/alpha crystallin family protein [Chloroflexota bacterium]